MKKNAIDVIDKVLNACYQHNPDALFIMSLMHQYEERGSLSKKQLQGLFSKAQKITTIPNGWLASLEAIILKMPTREKVPVDKLAVKVKEEKDTLSESRMNAILLKFPQHKRVLFLHSKYSNGEALSATEIAEIERLHKLLIK